MAGTDHGNNSGFPMEAGPAAGEGTHRASHGHGHEQSRRILINGHQGEDFPNNYISTAKYKLLSFFFAFLYEQFRRYSNIFFLAIGLLQQIPDVSPTGRFTTIVPLAIILTVSAIKEIIEDLKRHEADKEINNREVEVLRTGDWRPIKWKDIHVGDFVRLKNEHFFPADIVLLSSSDVHGLCYIETANLDGETNLKIRQGLSETITIHETVDFAAMTGTLSCELPNRHLYEFVGNITFNRGPELPLNPDQLLLRGAKLMNTNWIIGIVVYTGAETKLMKNSTAAPLKRSSVDKQTNTQIIFLFILLVAVSLISSMFSVWWIDQQNIWYIPPSSNTASGGNWKKTMLFIYSFLTFLILYNNLIPISLTVTLEVVRFIQALFINWDEDLRYKETDTPAMARTSNLNEELGQVRYVFSDKTGTLTRNIMEFKACTVAGVLYKADEIIGENNLLVQNLNNNHETSKEIRDFLMLLAVCHTVIPDYSTGELLYHAASPDEKALVLGAKGLGFEFLSRTPKTVEINANGTKEVYEILNVLEFTSTRKRMSVIVKAPDGKIRLLCKGADSVIYERLSNEPEITTRRITTAKHLEDFANEGLRTLCIAVTEIPTTTYEQWQEIFRRAATAIQNREEKMDDASTLVEKNLVLLGATAIEDKLQDQVPETIEALLTAGIHVWVLTGDKQETAINIGHSCRLLTMSMKLLIINCETLDATRESLVNHRMTLHIPNVSTEVPSTPHDAAVIIDGHSLKHAIQGDLRKMFIQLCCSCKAVIVCRASPLQKAEIVEYVTEFTGKITLAIGDGANDVAMIQKAHVGIGISGQEGLQASCASDYAIAQFCFLRKLLFVHGAWNFDRMCKIIFYSYYKNICLYIIELWFAIYSGWSGQIIFERWTIGLYNMMFTCAQPICMGLFERNCSEQLRLKYPIIYHPAKNPFRITRFFTWVLNSILHSAILFWLPWAMYGNGIVWGNGLEGGYLVLGNFIYTYVVVVVSIRSALETKSWTIFTHLSVWGSIVLWMLFLAAYSSVYMISKLKFAAEILGIGGMVFTSSVFWAGLIVVPSTTLLPDIVWITIQNTLYPSMIERFRQCDILRKDPSVFLDKEKLQNVEDCICPSDYFMDFNSSSFGSSSSATDSHDSCDSSSSQENSNIKKTPGNPNTEDRKEEKANSRLGSGGDQSIFPAIKKRSKTPSKGSNKSTDANDVDNSFKMGSVNQTTVNSLEKNVRFVFEGQSGDLPKAITLKRKTKDYKIIKHREKNISAKLHPSVHPSLFRTPTKLYRQETVQPKQRAELRQLFQQWLTDNSQENSPRPDQLLEHATS